MTATTTVLHAEAANDEVTQNQIDQAALDQKLQALKGLELDDAVVNVYVVKTSSTNKNKRFQKVMRLPCKDSLAADFKRYVTECIAGNEHISELREINSTQDNRFFHVESAATDFNQVVELVNATGIRDLTNTSELNGYNGYVIKLTITGEQEINLYAFRYIATAWSVKNSAGKFLCFDNDLVADVSSVPRFTITEQIDMIQLGESVFIADVDRFEKAMNYKERLEQKKNDAISALSASSALVTGGGNVLSRAVGTDKHLMRQLASVYSKPYYSNDIWLTKLYEVAQVQDSWLIQFDGDGKIQVQEDKSYIKELLTLLQNKRVRTVVDGVMFDVDGELIDLPAAS